MIEKQVYLFIHLLNQCMTILRDFKRNKHGMIGKTMSRPIAALTDISTTRQYSESCCEITCNCSNLLRVTVHQMRSGVPSRPICTPESDSIQRAEPKELFCSESYPTVAIKIQSMQGNRLCNQPFDLIIVLSSVMRKVL